MQNQDSNVQPTSESPPIGNAMLAAALISGAKIKIGKKYAHEMGGLKAGETITLIEGVFEHDNGLYCEDHTCQAIWNEEQKDFDSIYHLFGNDFEFFFDCKVVAER